MDKKVVKYPRIRYPDTEFERVLGNKDDWVYVEEKVDGSNFRFWLDDTGRIQFGSRNLILGNEAGGRWERVIKYLYQFEKKLKPDYEYFGEAMIPHLTPYKYDSLPPIIMFDIYDLKNEKWLDWESKTEEFKRVGLEGVRLVGIYTAGEIKNDFLSKEFKSLYYDGPAEGMVIKNYVRGALMKVVFREYKVQKHISGKKKVGEGTEYFLNKYVYDDYIRKIIFQLIDDGHKLDMSLMSLLPKTIFEDILEEHAKDILRENKVIDLGKFRRGIAKRSVNVLKFMTRGG